MDGENAPPTGLLRLLAILAALLLIAAAFGIRAVVGDGGGGDDEEVTSQGDGDGAIVLGCVTEVFPLCERLEGIAGAVEVNPGAVAEAIEADDIDAWMTFDPWPVAEDVAGGGLFEEETIRVAEDSLGLVLSKPYEERLLVDCDEDALTKCAAEATTIDGNARLGVGDPRSALGGILLAAMVTEVIGSPEFDIDAARDHSATVEAVLGSMPPKDQLSYRLTLDEQAPVAVLSREGVADDFVPTSPGVQKRLDFVPVAPPIRVRVVLAVVPGADRGDLENVIDIETDTPKLFEDLGWDNATDQPTGLPAGDVLLALVQEFGG
jgi:hypothetical protein